MTQKTRFAPSPTGFLHEGHLLSALYVWAVATIGGYRVHLRIEDHDQSRSRPEYIKAIYEDLRWFGFDWDSQSLQSERHPVYEKALQKLAENKLIYACDCSRKSLSLENPLGNDGEIIYQGHCLSKNLEISPFTSIRLRVPPKTIQWNDLRLGPFSESPTAQCGDFTLKDRHEQWTYQFAVCVDDIDENIGIVVRGEDLRSSTARQILLMSLLGKQHPPQYFHHPLLYDPSSMLKLSKRQHSESLRAQKTKGTTAEELLGKICFNEHLLNKEAPISLNTAIFLFSKQIERYFS